MSGFVQTKLVKLLQNSVNQIAGLYIGDRELLIRFRVPQNRLH